MSYLYSDGRKSHRSPDCIIPVTFFLHKKDEMKKDIAKKLISEDRVNFVCPANYEKTSDIYEVVTTILEKIKRDYDFDTLLQKHKNLAK